MKYNLRWDPLPIGLSKIPIGLIYFNQNVVIFPGILNKSLVAPFIADLCCHKILTSVNCHQPHSILIIMNWRRRVCSRSWGGGVSVTVGWLVGSSTRIAAAAWGTGDAKGAGLNVCIVCILEAKWYSNLNTVIRGWQLVATIDRRRSHGLSAHES